MTKRLPHGFTLIELLIVIAIVAILALVAVPNFLQAQTRAKVARARSDMKTLSTGLEAYAVDQNRYPRGNFWQLSTELNSTGADRSLVLLTTPISYIKTALLKDPFKTDFRDGGFIAPDLVPDDDVERLWYKFSACNGNGRIIGTVGTPDHDDPTVFTEWYLLQSSGPDLVRQTLGQGALRMNHKNFISTVYDPTNGITSRGNLYLVGGSPTGVGGFIFNAVRIANQ